MDKIYLDNAATTKPNGEYFNKAAESALNCFYNPSAKYHEGLEAANAVKLAKTKILSAFPEKKLFFTSCGTEADNTAVFGFVKRGNAITTLSEHAAIFNSFEKLKQKGGNVKYAKVDSVGRVDVDSLLSLIDDKTSFISVIHVNNETGAVNDIEEIAKAAKKINPSIVFHSDGVQAFCKLPIANYPSVDLYSVSAHKIGAIKGVGALLYNSKLHIEPYIVGGGQEDGLRSGTENVLGILDFSLCAESAVANAMANYQNAENCKKSFLTALDRSHIGVISDDACSPYIVSVFADGLKGEVLLHLMEDKGFIIGTGSACSSKHPHSRVIKECGYKSSVLDGVLRISFGFTTTEIEAQAAAKALSESACSLERIMKK